MKRLFIQAIPLQKKYLPITIMRLAHSPLLVTSKVQLIIINSLNQKYYFCIYEFSDINHKLLTGYLRLLENLNNESKLELIARLNDSIKADRQAIDERFTRAFGGWSKDDVAEEIINTIRGSRQQNRTNESL